MSSNMERVAAMPDASLYVNRDGRRADDCVDSMVERFCPGEKKHTHLVWHRSKNHRIEVFRRKN